MTLKELHSRFGKILDTNPSYGHRPVLFWRGKKLNGDDAFGQIRVISFYTLKMSPGSALDGLQNCVVLAPIPDFPDFKVPEDLNAQI